MQMFDEDLVKILGGKLEDGAAVFPFQEEAEKLKKIMEKEHPMRVFTHKAGEWRVVFVESVGDLSCE